MCHMSHSWKWTCCVTRWRNVGIPTCDNKFSVYIWYHKKAEAVVHVFSKMEQRNIDYVPHRTLCLGLTFRSWCSVITITILSISLISVIAAYNRNPGGWGPWEDKGSCSKPCGGGNQKQSRECYLWNKHSCQGDEERVIPCNTWNCPGKYWDWENAV